MKIIKLVNSQNSTKNAIGIDLNASFISAHVIQPSSGIIEPEILEFLGKNNLPSMVYIQPQCHPVCGYSAKNFIDGDETKRLVYWTNYLIGCKFQDPLVQYIKDHVGFKIVPDSNGYPVIVIDGESYTPEQITAMLLAHVKEAYHKKFYHEIDECVIAVPAYFNETQLRCTLHAAEIAGIKVKQFINQQTAAAVAFYEETKKDKTNVLVVDIGDLEVNVSIVNIDRSNFTVKSTTRDVKFDLKSDIDQIIFDYAIEEFIRRNPRYQDYLNTNRESSEVKRAHKILRKSCKDAIIKFSEELVPSSNIEVPNFWNNINLSIMLRRRIFEDLLDEHEICKRIFHLFDIAMKQANLEAKDIGDILMPQFLHCLIKLIADYFADNGVINALDLISTMNPETDVSKGALYIAQKAV